MKIRNQSILLLLLAITTFGWVKGVNFVGAEYMNPNSEYRQAYEYMWEKGYLTDEDLAELDRLKKAYLKDSRIRDEEYNRFFRSLFLGMFIFLLLSCFSGKTLLKRANTVILTITVMVSAFLASSLWQSPFWGLFFYAGIWLGKDGNRLTPR